MFNWIDWLIVLVMVYFVWQGWLEGVLRQSLSLITFLGSLWLAVRFHSQVGNFLSDKIGLGPGWSEVMGYLVVAIVAEFVLAEAAIAVLQKLPDKWWKSRANKYLGSMVSALQAGVIMTFVLLVIMALPIRGTIKADIEASVVGKRLVLYGEKYGGEVKSSVDRAAREAVRFLTVRPGTNESVPLQFDLESCELKIDQLAEEQMLKLVNSEREKAGVGALKVEAKIIPVARAHSADMLRRKYFSHISPEGEDAADRMKEGDVKFTLAGENLAFAADVATAHQGLMDSPGHKRNILESRFGRVGIGVINAGDCGMMFTQNFAD